ncbi:MAG: hypothetical protein NVS4B12_22300 [Ktedonobacteraceae bacterium]
MHDLMIKRDKSIRNIGMNGHDTDEFGQGHPQGDAPPIYKRAYGVPLSLIHTKINHVIGTVKA